MTETRRTTGQRQTIAVTLHDKTHVEACEWLNGEGYTLTVGRSGVTMDVTWEEWAALVSAVAGLQLGEATQRAGAA